MNSNKKETLEETGKRIFNETIDSIEKIATSFMENALKFVTDIFHVKTMCAMSKANKLLMLVIAGYIFLDAPLALNILLTIVPLLWLFDYFNVNLNFGSNEKDEKNDTLKKDESTKDSEEKKAKNISELSDAFVTGAEKMFSTFLKRSEEFVKGSFDDEKVCKMSFANKLLRIVIFGSIIVEIPLLLQAMIVIMIALWIAEYFEVEISFTKKTEKEAIAEKDEKIKDAKKRIKILEEALIESIKTKKKLDREQIVSNLGLES